MGVKFGSTYKEIHGNYHSVLVAHDTATNKELKLPEAVLIQFVSPDDEHDMLETCREL